MFLGSNWPRTTKNINYIILIGLSLNIQTKIESKKDFLSPASLNHTKSALLSYLMEIARTSPITENCLCITFTNPVTYLSTCTKIIPLLNQRHSPREYCITKRARSWFVFHRKWGKLVLVFDVTMDLEEMYGNTIMTLLNVFRWTMAI